MLDELRGIAIVMVFAFHSLYLGFGVGGLAWDGLFVELPQTWSLWVVAPATLGWIGVPIFFTVSGFCIHLSFVRGRSLSWGLFARRRFFRIYPAYFVVLVLLVWGHLIGILSAPGAMTPFLWQVATHLALVHNLFGATVYGINGSFWTIAVEAQLYLVYPLVYWAANRWGWSRVLCGTAAIEGGTRITAIVGILVGYPPAQWFVGWPLFFLYSWSIGASVADAYVNGRPIPFEKRSPLLWTIAAIASTCLLPTSVFAFPLFSLVTAIVIGRSVGKAVPVAGSVRRGLAFIGTVSYSVYLIHEVVLLHTIPVWEYLGLWESKPLIKYALCMASGIPTLGLAWLSYRYLEVPLAGLARRDRVAPAPRCVEVESVAPCPVPEESHSA